MRLILHKEINKAEDQLKAKMEEYAVFENGDSSEQKEVCTRVSGLSPANSIALLLALNQ